MQARKPARSSSSPEMKIEDAVQILVRAGYSVRKRSDKKGEQAAFSSFIRLLSWQRSANISN